MRYNAEPDPYTLPKLRLFAVAPHLSEPSTPPFQTSASIPFRWEEQPGKPRSRPSTDRIFSSTNRATARNTTLDLPPRLMIVEGSTVGNKTLSPTSAVDDGIGKSVFTSSSFRLTEEFLLLRRGWSRANEENGGGGQQERLLVGSGNGRRNGGGGRRRFRLFGVRGGGKRKGSFVISESLKSSIKTGFGEEKWRKTMRNSSVSNIRRSHFWEKIYEGFKQVLPWRKKPKTESYTL